MTASALTIEIYSDVVCPWCYVGQRRLQRTMATLSPAGDFQIAWRPFQLNPMAPPDGMDRMTYLAAKFGSVERIRQIEEQVVQAGTHEGIRFAFDKIATVPNTFEAHRLIWFAKRAGCQDAVVEALFRGYFEEGANIGDRSALAQLSARAGLKPDAVGEFFQSGEGLSEVKTEESVGQRLGIKGVPFFVLNSEYGISGAQPPEVLHRAIEHARGRASLPGASATPR